MPRFTIPLHIFIYLLNNFWVYGTLLLTMNTLVLVAIVLIAPSCPTLCVPMDYSPPGSSVHGILQARILEWVAISCSRGSSQPRDQTCVCCISCTAGGFFTAEPPEIYIHISVQQICCTDLFPSCVTEALTHQETILQSFLLIALGNDNYIFCFHGFY